MGYRYRRFARRSSGAYWASQHVAERRSLSSSMGGIDEDVERAFFSLPSFKLESVFLRYGDLHGASALAYARKTYQRWRSSAVRMSGLVAERLLNLVPLVLDPGTRFELVKKLRSAHLHKQRRHVSCEPSEWRDKLGPIIAEMLAASQEFQLPQHVVDRVRWLVNGDAVAAQRLLAAAEQEEAVVRLRYLEAEFARIESLLQSIEARKSVNHTIDLPQGTITICIKIPQKSLWNWLVNLLS